MRLINILFIALTLAPMSSGCLKADPAKAPARLASDAEAISSSTTPDAEVRDNARLTLEESCGTCHIGDTGGHEGALHVFDLSEQDWAARLTPEQAADAVRRLGEPAAPSGESNPATPEDVELVRGYLAERVGFPEPLKSEMPTDTDGQ